MTSDSYLQELKNLIINEKDPERFTKDSSGHYKIHGQNTIPSFEKITLLHDETPNGVLVPAYEPSSNQRYSERRNHETDKSNIESGNTPEEIDSKRTTTTLTQEINNINIGQSEQNVNSRFKYTDLNPKHIGTVEKLNSESLDESLQNNYSTNKTLFNLEKLDTQSGTTNFEGFVDPKVVRSKGFEGDVNDNAAAVKSYIHGKFEGHEHMTNNGSTYSVLHTLSNSTLPKSSTYTGYTVYLDKANEGKEFFAKRTAYEKSHRRYIPKTPKEKYKAPIGSSSTNNNETNIFRGQLISPSNEFIDRKSKNKTYLPNHAGDELVHQRLSIAQRSQDKLKNNKSIKSCEQTDGVKSNHFEAERQKGRGTVYPNSTTSTFVDETARDDLEQQRKKKSSYHNPVKIINPPSEQNLYWQTQSGIYPSSTLPGTMYPPQYQMAVPYGTLYPGHLHYYNHIPPNEPMYINYNMNGLPNGPNAWTYAQSNHSQNEIHNQPSSSDDSHNNNNNLKQTTVGYPNPYVPYWSPYPIMLSNGHAVYPGIVQPFWTPYPIPPSWPRNTTMGPMHYPQAYINPWGSIFYQNPAGIDVLYKMETAHSNQDNVLVTDGSSMPKAKAKHNWPTIPKKSVLPPEVDTLPVYTKPAVFIDENDEKIRHAFNRYLRHLKTKLLKKNNMIRNGRVYKENTGENIDSNKLEEYEEERNIKTKMKPFKEKKIGQTSTEEYKDQQELLKWKNPQLLDSSIDSQEEMKLALLDYIEKITKEIPPRTQTDEIENKSKRMEQTTINAPKTASNSLPSYEKGYIIRNNKFPSSKRKYDKKNLTQTTLPSYIKQGECEEQLENQLKEENQNKNTESKTTASDSKKYSRPPAGLFSRPEISVSKASNETKTESAYQLLFNEAVSKMKTETYKNKLRNMTNAAFERKTSSHAVYGPSCSILQNKPP